jgi:hypothetical protein
VNRSFIRRPQKEAKLRVHPIWRGVGCLMLVVFTFGSYVASSVLISGLNEAHRRQPFLPFPFQGGIPAMDYTLGTYVFPEPVREWPIPGYGPYKLVEPLRMIGPVKIEVTTWAFTLVLTMGLFAFSAVGWGVLVNPTRLAPGEAPPPRRRGRANLVR